MYSAYSSLGPWGYILLIVCIIPLLDVADKPKLGLWWNFSGPKENRVATVKELRQRGFLKLQEGVDVESLIDNPFKLKNSALMLLKVLSENPITRRWRTPGHAFLGRVTRCEEKQ